MIRDEETLLTIYCQSYNFGKYLRDAFEGFILQKTDFKFRVFVYDDASTDNSAEIINEYAEKYPEIFDIYISEKNMYNDPEYHNFLRVLKMKHIVGKYYAFCEGDDYWTDPYKLQKQVNFLEEHPDCSMTVHASHWINYDTCEEYDYHPYIGNRYLTPEEVILQTGGNPSTASSVYRTRDLFADADNTTPNVGDYSTQLYLLTRGRIYYFDEVMSVYRYKHEGSWSENYALNKCYAMECNRYLQVFLERYDRDTDYRFHKYVEAKHFSYFYDPMLLDPSINLDEYAKALESWENKSGYRFTDYKNDLERIGRIVRGTYRFTDEQIQMIGKSDYIIIMGCGEYSRILRHLIEDNGFEIDGYIISDDQKDHKPVDGKCVWKIKDYPFDISKSLIIIGLSQKNEIAIRNTLQKYNAKRVMDIFWIKQKTEL